MDNLAGGEQCADAIWMRTVWQGVTTARCLFELGQSGSGWPLPDVYFNYDNLWPQRRCLFKVNILRCYSFFICTMQDDSRWSAALKELQRSLRSNRERYWEWYLPWPVIVSLQQELEGCKDALEVFLTVTWFHAVIRVDWSVSGDPMPLVRANLGGIVSNSLGHQMIGDA